MDMELNEDQHALIDALSHLVSRHVAPPKDGNVSAVVQSHYWQALDDDSSTAGYFDIAREGSTARLEAALMIEEVSRSRSVVEVAASALVVPQVTRETLLRPVVLVRASDLHKPVRFLSVARTVLVDMGDDVAVVEVRPEDIEAVPAMYAYPYGQFRAAMNLTTARRLGAGSGAVLRHWWRVALATEAAAAMEQAVLLTVDYVKNRRQFGRPIGSFQAVQHRLAIDIQLVEGTKWLARRAAWTGAASDAALAALHAQNSIGQICYDCHQFHGAIGTTLEYPLHFWTFRLRALQGELGGSAAQARETASAVWNTESSC